MVQLKMFFFPKWIQCSEFRKKTFYNLDPQTFKIALLEWNSNENLSLLGRYYEDNTRALWVIEKERKLCIIRIRICLPAL